MTCDAARSHKKAVEGLLEAGVHVALLYGDADFRSDCTSHPILTCAFALLTITQLLGVGGEALSLALEHPSAETFRSAGYAPMRTSKTGKTAGYVRQSGGLSFIRVLDAGHLIPFFQPEVTQDIFMRASRRLDVATGTMPVTGEGNDYVTSGPESVWGIKIPPRPQAPEWCNPNYAPLWYVCTGNQIRALADGTAVVEDGLVVEPRADMEDLYVLETGVFDFLVNPE